ncbi:MAG: hypothetical protein QOK44_5320 [Betaproteobacteria bacterium]|nr:hypothetical protein [Betaproteobacteria bacterium]
MMLKGQAVMVNWTDVAVEHRHAYYEWHSREHMVGRVALPGFCRGRRYIAAQASRDFLICYEVENIGVLSSKAYLDKANAPSELTQRTTPFVKNSSRALARVRASLGVGTGGCALTLRFDAEPGREDELERHVIANALPRLAEIAEIAGAHFCIADMKASTIVPVERQGRPTTIPKWIVILEGVSLQAVNDACDAHLATLHQHGCTDRIERDTYNLQIMVTKKG